MYSDTYILLFLKKNHIFDLTFLTLLRL